MRIRHAVRRAAHRRFVEVEPDVAHVPHGALGVCSGASKQGLGKDAIFESAEAVWRIDIDLVLLVSVDVEFLMLVQTEYGSLGEVVRPLVFHRRY